MKDTPKQIAAAADRLFYKEGFAAVGIDQVVQEAGVALGTLYRHYAGRSELIAGALAHRDAAFLQAMEKVVEGLQGRDRILGLFDALGAWMRGKGNGCLFLRAASAHPRDKLVRGAAKAHKGAYLAFIRRQLEIAGWRPSEAERLAPSLYLLLEGAVASAFLLGNEAAAATARAAALPLLEPPPSDCRR